MQRNRYIFPLVLLFAALIIQLEACKETSDCPEVYFSEEFKEYVMFEPGSYWIYKDTVTGLIDSIFMLSCYSYLNEACPKYFNKNSEEISIEIFSNYYYTYYNYDIYLCGYMVGQGVIHSHYYGILHDNWSNNREIIIIDSIKVFNKTYYDVIIDSVNLSNPSVTYKTYWDKEKGPILKVFWDHSYDQWYHLGLLRSHVIKSE